MELLTHKEVIELAKKKDTGDLEARNTLVEANLGLVRSIAHKYKNRGLEYDDIFQEGVCGLLKAVDKYDHKKGYQFSTYATWWIYAEITKALDNAKAIYLPIELAQKKRKINFTKSELEKELGREPMPEDIASEMGLDVEIIEKVDIEQSTAPIESVGEIAGKESLDEEMDKKFLKENVKEMLSVLDPRERKIIELYYGLNGRELTCEEIGEELGVSRQRINQLKREAEKTLQIQKNQL